MLPADQTNRGCRRCNLRPGTTKELNGIATVTLNRPRTGNAITVQLRDEFDRVIVNLDHDEKARLLVIKADGAYFGTGYALKEFCDSAINAVHRRPQRRPHRRHPFLWRRDFQLSRERWMRLFRLRQCTFAVVHRRCAAGFMTAQVLYVAGGPRG